MRHISAAGLEALDTADAKSWSACALFLTVPVATLCAGEAGSHQSGVGATILVHGGLTLTVGEVHHAEDWQKA